MAFACYLPVYLTASRRSCSSPQAISATLRAMLTSSTCFSCIWAEVGCVALCTVGGYIRGPGAGRKLLGVSSELAGGCRM